MQQLNSLPVSSLPPSWVAFLAIKKEQSTGDVVVSTNPVASTPTVACGHRCAHIFMATEILQGKIGWSGAPASLSVSGAPKVQWSTGGFNQNGYVHRFSDASVPNMVKPRSLALNLCFKSPQMMLPHDLNHIHQIHQNHHSDENFSRTPMIQIDSRMDMCIYIYISIKIRLLSWWFPEKYHASLMIIATQKKRFLSGVRFQDGNVQFYVFPKKVPSYFPGVQLFHPFGAKNVIPKPKVQVGWSTCHDGRAAQVICLLKSRVRW